MLINKKLQHLDFKRLNEFQTGYICSETCFWIGAWVLFTACIAAAAHPAAHTCSVAHPLSLLPSRPIPSQSIPPVYRSGAQITRPAQWLCFPPMLRGNPSFNLRFVCATCAMPGRILPSEQLVVENRIVLNVKLGIRLLLLTVLCQNALNETGP